ncbi:MAG: hypothetical protein JO224_01810 [Pelomonas sp.]|nr:hypothetical protein [Roseateles sp.]
MNAYRWRLLTHGDTWFAPPGAGPGQASLLDELRFESPTALVSATAGAAADAGLLRHVVDLAAAPDFVRLLSAADAPVWDGIVLSVGGGDLVAAASVPAHRADGGEVPLEQRLLRRQTEWGPPSAGVGRYFSAPGWATLAEYLRANVRHVLSLRDQGPSAGKPVFVHCYAPPTPRPAGIEAPGEPVRGPWLYPAMRAYALPAADWPAFGRLLVSHFAQELRRMAADVENFRGLQVFDSTVVPLAAAATAATGSSGDWHDEIHLNHSGALKLGRAWSEHIGRVLNPPPPPTRRR